MKVTEKSVYNLGIKYIEVDAKSLNTFSSQSLATDTIDIVFIKFDTSIEDKLEHFLSFIKLVKDKKRVVVSLIMANIPRTSSELNSIKKESDSAFIIQNEDEYLQVTTNIINMLSSENENDITLDIADIKTVFENASLGVVEMSESHASNSPIVALKEVMNKVFQNDFNKENEMGVLIHFSVHPNIDILTLALAMEFVHDALNEESIIIWATKTDKQVKEEYTKVIVMAVENSSLFIANNLKYIG